MAHNRCRYYLGLWAAVDACVNGPDASRADAQRVYRTLLVNMAQVGVCRFACSLPAEPFQPQSFRTFAELAACRQGAAGGVGARRHASCIAHTPAGGKARVAVRCHGRCCSAVRARHALVAADKELATKAWRRMLAALEHLASQSVPETDMPVKRLRLGLKNVSVPGEPLPLSDYRRAECHAPALRERGAVGCCERGLAA